MTILKARELRREMTDAERKLWSSLRFRQIGKYKFRRQQPIGKFIVDFICFEQKLIVEVDGGQHGEQTRYDGERTAWLEHHGYRVLRFWNNEVLQETEGVIKVISDALASEIPPIVTSQ
ncbi:MAG: endonuclease domain-containing protein [Deltaproteobacteria bacterium]|nr:endonuclease domain-containing protein [Deltaproteobacteria bacterium]